LARGQSVLERPRPEYDPLGVRVGSFFFYPRGELSEVYNDNIFATKTGTKDDFITIVSPGGMLRSNWGEHELDLSAGADVGFYASHTSENYGDYFFNADGRYDFSRTMAALGTARIEHLHEDRDDPNSPAAAAHPVEFTAYNASAALAQRGLRIGYEGRLTFRREDYNNVSANGGGTINEQIRNVNIFTPSAQVSYEIVPNYAAFARAAGLIKVYDNSTAGSAANPARDSNGYRFDVGARIDLTGVTYAEAFIGYLSQNYNNPQLGTIGGVDFGARVTWNVTQLTSVIFNSDRTPTDANSTALTAGGVPLNSPGYLRTNVGVEVDHELVRNVILNFAANYQNDDYKGIDRNDDRYDITGGVRYLLNRNVYLGGAYTYSNRSSTGTAAGGEFSRNLFMLRLTGQL
jgi:hypothetical protein